MEVFVLGFNKAANKPFCFINISSRYFDETVLKIFTKTYKSLSIYDTNYRAAGADQICFEFSDLDEFKNFLQTETKATKLIKEMNLRLMRKGGTIYSPYHCFNLINDVLADCWLKIYYGNDE